MTKRVFMRVCLVLMLQFPLASGHARVSLDVPMESATYAYLDVLVAASAIRTAQGSQRPYTRGEVARMVDEAREYLATHEEQFSESPEVLHALRGIVRRLEREYRPQKFAFVRHADMSAVGLTHAERNIAVSNGLGVVDAQTAPLNVFNAGRDISEGVQLAIESYHGGNIGNFFAVAVQPRIFIRADVHADQQTAKVLLQEALVKFGSSRIELAVGRGRVVWGPGAHGDLLISEHAPPLDMVRLSTPQSFRLPWIFRHIGAIKGTMFVAALGSEYNPSNAVLSGYRFDLQPVPWFTFGVNHAMVMGGDGLQGPSVGQAMTEFIGFAGPLSKGNAPTNHVAGADLNFHIPPWRGLRLYLGYAYEDPDKNLAIQFDSQAAWVLGAYMPRLSADGAWSLRVEATRAGVGMYRHVPYLSGWSLRGQSLGLPYGGNSTAGMVTLGQRRLSAPTLNYQMGVVQRSGDTFQNTNNSSGDRIAITKLVNFPDEVGAQASVQMLMPLRRGMRLAARAGYEHVWNANFVAGQHQNNLLIEGQLTIPFGRVDNDSLAVGKSRRALKSGRSSLAPP